MGRLARAVASTIAGAGALALCVAGSGVGAGAVSASGFSRPILDRPPYTVWPQDAPDPDVVEFGSTYYAYTTGNVWGNHIGLLESKSPLSGWHQAVSGPFGSTAVPTGPSYLLPNTLTSPTVAEIGGRYVMFLDGQLRSDTSLYCMAVAVASSPTGPFVDHAKSPFGPCSTKFDGSIDPDLVQGTNGRYWLLWKENDSGPYTSAQIFSQELSPSGTSFDGRSRAILTQNSASFHWESTTEDPAMTYAGGIWWLIFSAGDWRTSSYSEAFVKCEGPSGPCGGDPTQLLTSYGRVHGPGGGTTFENRFGVWYLAFAAWTTPCTGAGGDCGRELYIAPIEFRTLSLATTRLPGAKAGHAYEAYVSAAGGLGARRWTASGLPAGMHLVASTGEVDGTPSTAGSRRVAFSVTVGSETRERTITIAVSS
ncbi:MAG: family 43 glycosylhydrolase [Acidimicrobiales bacterium]